MKIEVFIVLGLFACGSVPSEDDIGRQRSGDEECASSHPSIGQTAILQTLAHGVSGSATIVDDCTIRIENFNFDGGGVNARFYGALDGQWEQGFPMSDNLVRSSEYSNETITIQLPTKRSLDNLDGLSVWCIPFSADFGSGEFE